MTEQEFRKLVVYSMGVLAEQDVMHQVSFQLLDGHNDGLLRLQRGYKSNARICLSTGAVSPGDDHLVQHFLHYAADMEEMGAWLRDESNADAIIDSLKQLRIFHKIICISACLNLQLLRCRRSPMHHIASLLRLAAANPFGA